MFGFTTKARHSYWKISICSLILFLGLGCEAPIPEGYVGVQVDGKDKAGLAHFYVGSMPGAAPRATEHEGLFLIDRATLPSEMLAVVEDNRIEWSVFLDVVQEHYARWQSVPKTVDELLVGHPALLDSTYWFTKEVKGSLTDAWRAIHVPRTAIQQALHQTIDSTRAVVYPIGTVFLAEHRTTLGGPVVEYMAMHKREDGAWNYLVFDADGAYTPVSLANPKAYAAPTQCTGCHFGDRAFEPERSFPGLAADGPFGTRSINVTPRIRELSNPSLLSEHAKRADHVLGLYGTLYLAEVQSRLERGNAMSEIDLQINADLNKP